MLNKCCHLLNEINLFVFKDRITLAPCCQFYHHKNKELIAKYDCHADLKNWRELVNNLRIEFLNNKKICSECSVKTPCSEDFRLSPSQFNLFISGACNLNCEYCCSSVPNDNIYLSDIFLENKDLIKNIVSDSSIKIITSSGHGEFFINKPLMDLFLEWKIEYNKKIMVTTNLIEYDPEYPIDILVVSWHKSADKKKFIDNLKKIPCNLLKKIEVCMMIGDPKYAFSLEEAYELVKTYLDPSIHDVSYTGLMGTGTGCYNGNFSNSEINKIKYETRALGFAMSFNDYKY